MGYVMIYKLLIFLCIFSLGSYSKELLIKEDISNSEQFFELIFKNINNEKINIKFENNIPNFLIKLGVNKDTEIILDSSENNLTDLDKFKEIPFINSFKDFYKNFIEKVIEMVNNLKIDIIDENITSDKKLFLINVIKYKYQIGLKKYAFDEIIKKLFYGKSGDFIYKNMLTNKNDQYYHQGYKIHVSATEASAFKILSLLYNE